MIITLCGSARFEKEFKDMNKRLSLEGHIVHTLACYPSDEGRKDWYTPVQKHILDEVYLLKIENSDAILVLNVDGYVGIGGRREIFYALSKGKRIFFLSSKIPEDSELADIHHKSESLGIIMPMWKDYSMDPNENLKTQRGLADDILKEADKEVPNLIIMSGFAVALAENQRALDKWLQDGGLVPKDW